MEESKTSYFYFELDYIKRENIAKCRLSTYTMYLVEMKSYVSETMATFDMCMCCAYVFETLKMVATDDI